MLWTFRGGGGVGSGDGDCQKSSNHYGQNGDCLAWEISVDYVRVFCIYLEGPSSHKQPEYAVAVAVLVVSLARSQRTPRIRQIWKRFATPSTSTTTKFFSIDGCAEETMDWPSLCLPARDPAKTTPLSSRALGHEGAPLEVAVRGLPVALAAHHVHARDLACGQAGASA